MRSQTFTVPLSSPLKVSTGKASDDKDGKDDESDVRSDWLVVNKR